MKHFFHKAWPYLVALLVFAVVSCIYMSPALEGKVIDANDGVQAHAAVQEPLRYQEESGGDGTWWIGSLFSGMPGYQVGGGIYEADIWMRPIKRPLHIGLRNVAGMVFIYCLSFFVLLSSMKINRWLSIVGALAMAFSSYFFIIIGANHQTKTVTIALMAMVVAGFYLIYRQRRYGLGVVLTMIALAAGFYLHVQMSYYYCFILGFFFLAELWNHLKEKQMKIFGIKTAIFLGAFIVGLGTGTSATFANMEYAGQTMRGGHSDLAKVTDETNKTDGLDLDYATAWSYGIDESLTFMIPDFMGGSSHYPVGKDSEIYTTMVKRGMDRRTAEQFTNAMPTYWGEQPFTAGPVYMGAIVCFLFVLGLLIVKGPYKWAILGVTLLSVFLSWGHNWMGLTSFFFEHVPMYNKFRAVSSFLVVAEVTMPLLGFLALKQITEERLSREEALKAIYISSGLTAGVCLFLALFGSSMFDFVSSSDSRMFAQWPQWLTDALVAQRESMFVSDCWRSFTFIVLAALLLWIYVKSAKMKVGLLALLLGALVLADMWPVNKRYMNDSAFTKKSNFEALFKPQPWEKQILQDKDPHFRVYNLTTSPFNDARTSCHLKSIGGYSAAKLRRYQDIIDEHLSKGNMKVINMLNTKYIITADQQGRPVPQLNPGAMGNAWFVDSLVVAQTANEESAALNHLDLRTTAVVDKEFAPSASTLVPGHDATAQIRLTKYTPKYIEYESSAAQDGIAVFSEIYYPFGWKAYIDGQPADHFRVDYVLRAMNVPAGKHHIRFEFRPDSVAKGNILSMIFVVIMYITIAFYSVRYILKLRKQ